MELVDPDIDARRPQIMRETQSKCLIKTRIAQEVCLHGAIIKSDHGLFDHGLSEQMRILGSHIEEID